MPGVDEVGLERSGASPIIYLLDNGNRLFGCTVPLNMVEYILIQAPPPTP